MHRSCQRVLASIALSSLAATIQSDELFVGPPGSGAAFTEISDALVAASAGDVIRVAPGTYGAFSVQVPVRVLGAGSSSVFIAPGIGVNVAEVIGIPAGSSATISGMTFQEPSASSLSFVHVSNSAGSVNLHDLEGIDANAGSHVAELVRVENCAGVVLDRVRFLAEQVGTPTGGVPLVVDGSVVSVADRR